MTGTSYDTVAYPSATFPQTYPDRLAVFARLHGLDAPAIDTARVLEIGGGDGFNLIALAAAWPRAQFYSFDLSGDAVARGRMLIKAAGLENMRLEQADILDVAATIAPGSYDYIIAHGVYAWVPEPVRAAIMALVGKALAPDGLFFVSYNAMPGGHVRRVMRDMLLHELEGIEAIEDRIRAARAFLTDHAKPREGDDAVVACMRAQSKSMLERPDAVLFHDEFGECFAPQYLSDVAAGAAAHGLEFLNDAGKKRADDGFLPPDSDVASDKASAQVVRRAQTDDFAEMRFFRQSVFVRAGRNPTRGHDLARFGECLMTGQLQADEDGGIKVGEVKFKLRDEGLTNRLLEMGDGWPVYRRIDTIALNEEQLEAIYRLWNMSVIHVSTVPPPYMLAVNQRPKASALARGEIALGRDTITTLHFEAMHIVDPIARDLLVLLDGSRTLAELAQIWDEMEHPGEIDVIRAIASCGARRLLIG